jgi:predicted branched-subunit amino acid permease
MLALFAVNLHQSKACADSAYGKWNYLYWFGPALIGFVVGATVTDDWEGKLACAFGIAIAALVIAFFLSYTGDVSGQCGIG